MCLNTCDRVLCLTHTHTSEECYQIGVFCRRGLGAVVAGAGVRFHREVWFKRRGAAWGVGVEWRAERGLWRCKWRSVVRCCAADVFGKLRGPAARAALRVCVCVRVNWPLVCYYSHMYLYRIQKRGVKLYNKIPLVGLALADALK